MFGLRYPVAHAERVGALIHVWKGTRYFLMGIRKGCRYVTALIPPSRRAGAVVLSQPRARGQDAHVLAFWDGAIHLTVASVNASRARALKRVCKGDCDT